MMNKDYQELIENYIRLALSINEHLPGYIDSYFGPDEWAQDAGKVGKLELPTLLQEAERLAVNISQANEWDVQRKDFLMHQVTAMQMSLRLLAGETVSLVEEAQALYDIHPTWKDESYFIEYQKWLEDVLPKGGSLRERFESWQKSIEIPLEKVEQLLPFLINTFRELTHKKFDLPENESFTVEFISDQSWMAYNQYLGEYKSRIEINTDMPMQIKDLAVTIAHEGYPGHHTELSTKDARLIKQKGYQEHQLTLINSPWAVITEGIATSALETLLTDQELEDLYREELLPRAEMTDIDIKTIMGVSRAERKVRELWGNAAFMLHEQKKSTSEIVAYLQKYELSTEKEANRAIQFISGPLDRSYIFTYTAGYDLLEKLFSTANREKYFIRLLGEPVTPSRVRQWIENESHSK
ncbi:MAG: hypothetical protein IPP66_11445 [Anaerolineales bacterium]|nr:hypothetical protein [Anaerolineales bacterium]